MSKSSITKVSQTNWSAIEQMADSDIDLTDIPEITAEQMARAKMRMGGKTVPQGKIRVNMYLDAEIVEYFKTKAKGRGYQTLINQTLRDNMLQRNFEQTLRHIIREELSLAR